MMEVIYDPHVVRAMSHAAWKSGFHTKTSISPPQLLLLLLLLMLFCSNKLPPSKS